MQTIAEFLKDESISEKVRKVVSSIEKQVVYVFDNDNYVGTGTLVQPDLILMAGHCINGNNTYGYMEGDILVTKAFGDYHEAIKKRNYEYDPNITPDVDDHSLTQEDLNGDLQAKLHYDSQDALPNCLSKKLTIVCYQVSGAIDFALLKLDSPILDVIPIQISTDNEPSDQLFIIHHSEGKPKQISIADRVKKYETNEFKLAYITTGAGDGSSGAGVFNTLGQLVAIHNDRPLIKEDETKDPIWVASFFKKFDPRDKPLGGTLIKEIVSEQTEAAKLFTKMLNLAPTSLGLINK